MKDKNKLVNSLFKRLKHDFLSKAPSFSFCKFQVQVEFTKFKYYSIDTVLKAKMPLPLNILL